MIENLKIEAAALYDINQSRIGNQFRVSFTEDGVDQDIITTDPIYALQAFLNRVAMNRSKEFEKIY